MLISGVNTSFDKRRQKRQKYVYFTAGITEKISYANNMRINFNKIITNVGGAYNHGVFVAPRNGFYKFTVTLVTNHNAAQDACGYLRKNGTPLVDILAEDAAHTFQAATATVILQLSKSDSVDVAAHHTHGGFSAYGSAVPAALFTGELLSRL